MGGENEYLKHIIIFIIVCITLSEADIFVFLIQAAIALCFLSLLAVSPSSSCLSQKLS